MIIWTMDIGGEGMRAQTRGLASRIVSLSDGAGDISVTEKTVSPSLWNRFFAPPLFAETRPDMIIACGHAVARTAVACKKKYNAFVVYLQKPPIAARHFDAVICGKHDNLSADNVLSIIGSVGGVRNFPKEKKPPRPITGVLVGGCNRAYKLSPAVCKKLVGSIQKAAGDDAILLTTSRRTGEKNGRAFAAILSDKSFLPPSAAHNPYGDILAAADRFVVTGDSVNMLSEACSLARPVYIFSLPTKFPKMRAAKFRAVHQQLVDGNFAKMWDGEFADWQPPKLDETARAAKFVINRFAMRRR